MKGKPKKNPRSIAALQHATTNLAAVWAKSTDSGPSMIRLGREDVDFPSGCKVCHDLAVTRAGLEIEIRSLNSSSRLGCASCALLTIVLKPHGVCSRDEGSIYLACEEHGTLKLQFDDESNDRQLVKLDVYTVGGISGPWPSINPYTGAFGTSDASTAIHLIKQWLKDCTKNHNHGVCRISMAPQLLSTRLLEIQGPTQIRLHTPSPKERAYYACLSHCWGGSVALQTTRAVEEQYHDQVSWSLLPRTFRDAVDLTWRLGLRYLWIDSLCILQDDLDDWSHEGSKMADIYSRSYVTLAATKSANADGGFYTDPSYTTLTGIHRVQYGTEAPYTIHVRKSLQHKTFFNGELPLMTRAWAFQERVLSPRVVHFTDEELFWECTAKSTCECGHCGPGSWYGLDKNMFTDDVQNVRLREHWYQIVHHYSQLNLSFQKDVFPALQGIVKRMQSVRKCAYLAGLWEDSIVEDLMWHCDKPDESLSSVYRAPTWSWASRMVGASYPFIAERFPLKCDLSIVSVSVTPKGLDPTGEISAALLVLEGRCKKASVNVLDTGYEIVPHQHGQIASDHDEVVERPSRHMWYGPDIRLEGSVEVLLLLIGTSSIGHQWTTTDFLVVRLARDKDRSACDAPMYERVGIGECGDDDSAKFFGGLEKTRIQII